MILNFTTAEQALISAHVNESEQALNCLKMLYEYTQKSKRQINQIADTQASVNIAQCLAQNYKDKTLGQICTVRTQI